MKTEQIIKQVNQLVSFSDRIPGKGIVIGNDIVHLPGFIKSCTPHFIRRVYTPGESAYCAKFSDSILRYASTWAAKEAVYKAIKQTDDTIKLWWRDIEIVRAKAAGKPTVQIKKIIMPLEFSLSISHDGDYIWAIAICLSDKK